MDSPHTAFENGQPCDCVHLAWWHWKRRCRAQSGGHNIVRLYGSLLDGVITYNYTVQVFFEKRRALAFSGCRY